MSDEDYRREVLALADSLWMMSDRGMAQGTTTWASMGAASEQLRILVATVAALTAENAALQNDLFAAIANEDSGWVKGADFDALTAENARLHDVADLLAVALRGWESLDDACDDASGRSDDPAVVAASERLDATFEAVWAARDDALAKYDALAASREATP